MGKKTGNKKKRPSKREKRMQIRLKESEKQRFESAAIEADMTLSEWVIAACETRYKKQVLRENNNSNSTGPPRH